MSGLSKNVMNMKFMQKSAGQSGTDSSVEKSKVKDSSEWELPSKVRIQKTLKPAIQVSSVGYGSIASLTQEDNTSPSAAEAAEETSRSQSKSQNGKRDEAQKFLAEILGDSKKRKKKSKKEAQSKKPKAE